MMKRGISPVEWLPGRRFALSKNLVTPIWPTLTFTYIFPNDELFQLTNIQNVLSTFQPFKFFKLNCSHHLYCYYQFIKWPETNQVNTTASLRDFYETHGYKGVRIRKEEDYAPCQLRFLEGQPRLEPGFKRVPTRRFCLGQQRSVKSWRLKEQTRYALKVHPVISPLLTPITVYSLWYIEFVHYGTLRSTRRGFCILVQTIVGLVRPKARELWLIGRPLLTTQI